jgi:hypothetical protein
MMCEQDKAMIGRRVYLGDLCTRRCEIFHATASAFIDTVLSFILRIMVERLQSEVRAA